MRNRLTGGPLSSDGAALVRRANAAAAASVAGGGDEDDDAAGAAEERAFAVLGRRLRIASPERVRRALREPWKVTPGSLISAVMPAGRRSTAHFGAPCQAMLGRRWPADDLWIVAVDLDVGSRVVFGRDGARPATIGQAVEASCAIPGFFAPVTIDHARYVDGAVHSTTNADLVVDFDPRPDVVVVCAPMSAVSGAVPRTQALSIRQLARRQVAVEAATLRAAGSEVVTFQPTAEDLAVMAGDSMDAAKAAAVCARVGESTRVHLASPEIADRLAALRR
jgi:NTE family protein